MEKTRQRDSYLTYRGFGMVEFQTPGQPLLGQETQLRYDELIELYSCVASGEEG